MSSSAVDSQQQHQEQGNNITAAPVDDESKDELSSSQKNKQSSSPRNLRLLSTRKSSSSSTKSMTSSANSDYTTKTGSSSSSTSNNDDNKLLKSTNDSNGTTTALGMDRPATSIAAITSPEEAREKVQEFFRHSTLANTTTQTAASVNVPTFDRSELIRGKFLGRGGFSDVEEIQMVQLLNDKQRYKLKRSNSLAINDKESRKFIAEHCIRPSGDARYAIKHLRRDIVVAAAAAAKEEEEEEDCCSSTKNQRFYASMVDLAIETRFLSHLEHPNIIKMRATANCSPYSKEYFLVLDRLYDTLKTRIACQWRLRHQRLRRRSILGRFLMDRKGEKYKDFLQERLAAAYDLSAAVAYLHEHHIIHRDIKTDNIGFDIRGDIRIFDFGMARELRTEDADDEGTYKLSRMTGSLRYMAPEVALGKRYNEGCDVYSFCIVLWEILALERPYNNFKSEETFMSKVFEKGARPPLQTSWPNSYKKLLERGWVENLQERIKMDEISKLLRSEVIQLRHGDDSGLEHTHRRSTFVFETSKGAAKAARV